MERWRDGYYLSFLMLDLIFLIHTLPPHPLPATALLFFYRLGPVKHPVRCFIKSLTCWNGQSRSRGS